MHIILTHEQADFDALGSLLGASLLLETAVPVLPRRMNRNVRAFLALYGAELPFIDPGDLHNTTVEKITLVDTQSLISVRGMNAETRVNVIDHHPRRDGVPPEWSLSLHETGATATVLVEALQEHNGPLSPIQATLLLLGIYEDTGSLTYARTTARDLRAAAVLVEVGADLQIAANFLNHPLSSAQQSIYDRLRQSAENMRIHGHVVILATAHAYDSDEELSSITHKLRDLLDPDALFVLVKLRSGVQLIARSTNDSIDVSAVAAHFGGGGHDRAAAALIRNLDLDSARSELISVLEEIVRPAITVAQIMSRGLQVLSPDTPVEEADRRMRVFGYEGYPVVDNGRVVGLVTRRAVDRAMTYKLNKPVNTIMESGSHTVTPDDSIEEVQRLVTDTGWGQLPVVDPVNRSIIGVVTRTDLLKNLSPGKPAPGRVNLASRLEKSLPGDRLALLQAVAEAATEQHAALYLVGGFVRDLILERPSPDFDLVVEGDAIALARSLASNFGGRVTGHSRFGTAKWHLEGKAGDKRCILAVEGLDSIDLVTARTEFYTHPTALPTIERGSIKLDLHRRDFTINTLALRLDGRHYGELHDYWGGLEDLRNGLVRVLHSLSFVDDPTRMLRAVRFEQRFAFSIENRTMQLLKDADEQIKRLSGDRIRHELNHILSSDYSAQTLARLHELGLLAAIHADLPWDDWLYARIEALQSVQPEPDWDLPLSGKQLQQELGYVLWLMTISAEKVGGVVGRLKLPQQLSDAIQAAARLWRERFALSDAPPSTVADMLEDVPALASFALYLASGDLHVRSRIRSYVSHWKHLRPFTDGYTLRTRGLPPSPHYAHILRRLRAAWLDGEISTEEQEQRLLDRLIKEIDHERAE